MKISKCPIHFIFLLLLFGYSCYNNSRKNSDIAFTDTIYKKHVLSIENNDIVWQHDTIHFLKTNSTIEKSNFFYEECTQPCSDENTYRIYFDKRQVILFCDSMLNSFPPNPNNELDAYSRQRVGYQKIRNQATSNKMDNAVSLYELPTLFDRFNPLIQNPKTEETINYIIVKDEEKGPGGKIKKYLIRNKSGDTITLAILPIRAMELQDIEL